MDFKVFREFLDKLEGNLARAFDTAEKRAANAESVESRATAQAKADALREVCDALTDTIHDMGWRE